MTRNWTSPDIANFFHSIPRYNTDLDEVSNKFDLNSTEYHQSLALLGSLHLIWLIIISILLAIFACIIFRAFTKRRKRIKVVKCLNRCPTLLVLPILMLVGCIMLILFCFIYETHIHLFLMHKMERRDPDPELHRFPINQTELVNETLRFFIFLFLYFVIFILLVLSLFLVTRLIPYSYWCPLYLILIFTAVTAGFLTAEALFLGDACQKLLHTAQYLKPHYNETIIEEVHASEDIIYSICMRDNVILRVVAQLVAILIIALIVTIMLFIFIVKRFSQYANAIKYKSPFTFLRAFYKSYKRRKAFAKARRSPKGVCKPTCPDDTFQPCWSTTPINKKLFNKCCAKFKKCSPEYLEGVRRRQESDDAPPKCLPCLGTCDLPESELQLFKSYSPRGSPKKCIPDQDISAEELQYGTCQQQKQLSHQQFKRSKCYDKIAPPEEQLPLSCTPSYLGYPEQPPMPLHQPTPNLKLHPGSNPNLCLDERPCPSSLCDPIAGSSQRIQSCRDSLKTMKKKNSKTCRPSEYYNPPLFHAPPKMYRNPSINASKRSKPKKKHRIKPELGYEKDTCTPCLPPPVRIVDNLTPCQFSNRLKPCSSSHEVCKRKSKKSKESKLDINCPSNPGSLTGVCRKVSDEKYFDPQSEEFNKICSSLEDTVEIPTPEKQPKLLSNKSLINSYKRNSSSSLLGSLPSPIPSECQDQTSSKIKTNKASTKSKSKSEKSFKSNSPCIPTVNQYERFPHQEQHENESPEEKCKKRTKSRSRSKLSLNSNSSPDVIPSVNPISQYPDVITECPHENPSRSLKPPRSPVGSKGKAKKSQRVAQTCESDIPKCSPSSSTSRRCVRVKYRKECPEPNRNYMYSPIALDCPYESSYPYVYDDDDPQRECTIDSKKNRPTCPYIPQEKTMTCQQSALLYPNSAVPSTQAFPEPQGSSFSQYQSQDPTEKTPNCSIRTTPVNKIKSNKKNSYLKAKYSNKKVSHSQELHQNEYSSPQYRPLFVKSHSPMKPPTLCYRRSKLVPIHRKKTSIKEKMCLQNEIVDSFSSSQFLPVLLSTNSSFKQSMQSPKIRKKILKTNSPSLKSRLRSRKISTTKRSVVSFPSPKYSNIFSPQSSLTQLEQKRDSNDNFKSFTSILKNSSNKEQNKNLTPSSPKSLTASVYSPNHNKQPKVWRGKEGSKLKYCAGTLKDILNKHPKSLDDRGINSMLDTKNVSKMDLRSPIESPPLNSKKNIKVSKLKPFTSFLKGTEKNQNQNLESSLNKQRLASVVTKHSSNKQLGLKKESNEKFKSIISIVKNSSNTDQMSLKDKDLTVASSLQSLGSSVKARLLIKTLAVKGRRSKKRSALESNPLKDERLTLNQSPIEHKLPDTIKQSPAKKAPLINQSKIKSFLKSTPRNEKKPLPDHCESLRILRKISNVTTSSTKQQFQSNTKVKNRSKLDTSIPKDTLKTKDKTYSKQKLSRGKSLKSASISQLPSCISTTLSATKKSAPMIQKTKKTPKFNRSSLKDTIHKRPTSSKNSGNLYSSQQWPVTIPTCSSVSKSPSSTESSKIKSKPLKPEKLLMQNKHDASFLSIQKQYNLRRMHSPMSLKEKKIKSKNRLKPTFSPEKKITPKFSPTTNKPTLNTQLMNNFILDTRLKEDTDKGLPSTNVAKSFVSLQQSQTLLDKKAFKKPADNIEPNHPVKPDHPTNIDSCADSKETLLSTFLPIKPVKKCETMKKPKLKSELKEKAEKNHTLTKIVKSFTSPQQNQSLLINQLPQKKPDNDKTRSKNS